jgi:beta-glucosidase
MRPSSVAPERRVAQLIDRMTLEEKIGQMCQVDAGGPDAPDRLGEDVRAGRIGALINLVDADAIQALQRIAIGESRLGIPLLVGRDVIHGFSTVMPIPLGQAATWDPGLVRDCARAAAAEAAAVGINWTFAPMIDIARDARWGRIAESFGEDPWLTSRLGVAAVAGFQGEDLSARDSIAACAKHFAGYGAAEGGRDYAATHIPESELRNVYLPPFHAAVDAGVATLMASFSDLDGIPASANRYLMDDILRSEWGFDGFVVSDWDSIRQLAIHGLTGCDRDSAFAAATAGLDMEMAGNAYRQHLADLVRDGRIEIGVVDRAVANLLRIKFRLGLFERSGSDSDPAVEDIRVFASATARRAALESIVLLKNEGGVLPLRRERIRSLAVIGPLAHAPYEQLGTWIFDGDPSRSVTPLDGIRQLVGDEVGIRHIPALETSRSRATASFPEAVDAARAADATVVFLGEESILSGEAHCRADIGLPGAQSTLVRMLRQSGKPLVAVVLAGRPLTLTDIVDEVDAILYAWHPGTQGGPAIADLLFGVESPSGKLPATFPRMVGQIPIYYGHRNTGKPPTPDTVVHIDEIEAQAPQTSFGMTSFHLDAGYRPLFPFGHGLSYTEFRYDALTLSAPAIRRGESLTIGVTVTNVGDVDADEIVQLYTRDLVGSITRPVRELKGFRRVRIEAGQTVNVEFVLHTDDLAFWRPGRRPAAEPGDFHLWAGGSSDAGLRSEFTVLDDDRGGPDAA